MRFLEWMVVREQQLGKDIQCPICGEDALFYDYGKGNTEISCQNEECENYPSYKREKGEW